jgi:hypothetical protein
LGLAPVQTPFWQVSLWVQGLLSLQVVLLALTGFVHPPVVALQVPVSWH